MESILGASLVAGVLPEFFAVKIFRATLWRATFTKLKESTVNIAVCFADAANTCFFTIELSK